VGYYRTVWNPISSLLEDYILMVHQPVSHYASERLATCPGRLLWSGSCFYNPRTLLILYNSTYCTHLCPSATSKKVDTFSTKIPCSCVSKMKSILHIAYTVGAGDSGWPEMSRCNVSKSFKIKAESLGKHLLFQNLDFNYSLHSCVCRV